MALQLNDSANVKKAPTGPNPQARLPAAENGGVNSIGPLAGAIAGTGTPPLVAPIGQKPSYNYATDPILQMVTGQQQLAISQAEAATRAQQAQTLIAYGDPNLATAVLGDKNTAAAAAANPASTLAQLAAKNTQNVRGINEAENKQNLFFSTDRGYQLGLAQQAYLADQAKAAGDVQSTLSGLTGNLLATKQTAFDREVAANQAAYNRALAHPIGVTQPTPHPSGVTQLQAMIARNPHLRNAV